METLLGKTGKDKASGFVGVITARCEYLFESPRICLTARCDKDNKPAKDIWYAEAAVEILKEE